MTLAECIASYFIYIIYHNPGSDLKAYVPDVSYLTILRILLYSLPINLLILFALEKFSDMGNGFFFSAGSAGRNHYSRERSMAAHGEREEACQRLAKAASRGDSQALRLLAEIATQEPVMHVWMSKATILRGKAKGMTREDHAGLDAMLSRLRKPS
jgi:hypothetical protein